MSALAGRSAESFRWAAGTSKDLAARDRARLVAVLPLGATEQHGPHLPLGTDSAIVDAVVERTIERLRATELEALFLPTQPVGKSDEHARYPGTLTLSAETAIRLWTEIGASVASAGLRRIVLLNAHGGHFGPVEIAARDLRVRCGMLAIGCDLARFGLPEGLFSAEEERFGIHAGAVETSLMLAIRPESVDLAEARHFPSRREEDLRGFRRIGRPGARIGWAIQDLNPHGACGDATAASAAAGARILDFWAGQVLEVIGDAAAFPLDRFATDPAW